MVHDLLTRTESELAGMAVAGFANAGPRLARLAALADDLSAAGLGRLGDRLRTVGDAADERARMAAWAAAWTGVEVVRTRLLKPVTIDTQGAMALPQAPNVLFPWPLETPVPAEGAPGEIDALLAALQSPQPLARAYAASHLAGQGGDEAVPRLLAMQKQCGRCIRFLVGETLGRIASDAALAGLVDLLGDADVARPVEAALLALGERSAGPLAEALAQAKPKDKPRRHAIAKLLWQLRAGEALRGYLNDKDQLVAAYAQAALWPAERLVERARQKGAAGLPAAATLFEQQRLDLDALAKQIDALSKNQQAETAAVVRHSRAEPPLLAHYLAQMTAGRNKKAREGAAAFVAGLANPATLPALLRLVPTAMPLLAAKARLTADVPLITVGRVAATGLGELADPAAVWPLIRAAQAFQRVPYVCDPMVWALGRIGDPAAAPLLLEMLNEADPRGSRYTIEAALAALGAPAAEAIGQALLAPNQAPATATVLERVLMKIKSPQAQAALAAYRAGTSELTRLIAHLSDGKAPEALVKQAADLGTEALEPLLGLLAKGFPQGRINATRALARLAVTLADEQRERVVDALRAELRAQQPGTRSPGYGHLYVPLVEQIVSALCDLDACAAEPEVRTALMFNGVDKILAKSWKQRQRPWLLDVVVQGIQATDTRLYALHVAEQMPLDDTTRPRLWPAVEAVVQSETNAYPLMAAVDCLRAWGDTQGLPLLQALKNRMAAVTGYGWSKDSLNKHLDATLAELDKKRSLLGRLLGR
jgi:HEAT repeat protein